MTSLNPRLLFITVSFQPGYAVPPACERSVATLSDKRGIAAKPCSLEGLRSRRCSSFNPAMCHAVIAANDIKLRSFRVAGQQWRRFHKVNESSVTPWLPSVGTVNQSSQPPQLDQHLGNQPTM